MEQKVGIHLISLGVTAAGSIRWTQGHLGAELAGLLLHPGTAQGNSTSKRSPAGAGGPGAVSGRAGGNKGDAPRCRGSPWQQHLPRHDAHMVQNSCRWGEWVNTKKKGTAALLLKI